MTYRPLIPLSLLALAFTHSALSASLTTQAHLQWDTDDISHLAGQFFPMAHGTCAQNGTAVAECDNGLGHFAIAHAAYGALDYAVQTWAYEFIIQDSGWASAGFEDFLYITGPFSNAWLRVEVSATYGSFECGWGEMSLGYNCSPLVDVDGTIAFPTPIVAGKPIKLWATGGGYGNGDWHGGFCCSEGALQIKRILITDENGTPLPGIHLRSESGTIYKLDEMNQVAAPEPTACLMIGISLLGLRCWKRKRRAAS